MLAHVPGVRPVLVLVLLLGYFSGTAHAAGWSLEHAVGYSAADFVLEPSADGLRILSPSGLELGLEGAPRTPLELIDLVLPQGMRIEQVTLRDARWEELAEGRLQAQAAVLGSDSEPALREEDRFGFGDARQPTLVARAGSSGGLAGFSIGSVELLPVRETAEGRIEYLSSGVLQIELGVDPRERLQRRIEWPGRREAALRSVTGLVDNPADVDRYAPAEGKSPSLLVEPRPGDGLARTERAEPRPIDFLIITSAALAPSYQPLADRRDAEGLATVIVTLDEIFATATPGADQQETIRNYIRDAWAWWGVDYVMLAGDSELIPPRYARSTYYPVGSYTDVPSDLYYAALDGTWNADGNGIPGQPTDDVDMLAEVSIGRVSMNTPAQVDAWLAKLVAYEKPSDDTQFLGRTLFLSEVLFPDDWTPQVGGPISVDGATYSEDLYFDEILAGGNLMQAWRMYQNHTAYAGAIPETYAAAMDSLNTGHFGLVNHIGHGFYYNASVGDKNIFADDADALTNPNPFFIHALNCSSGAFDVDCLLERFLQNMNGGAVGSAGSSRAAFPYWSAFYQQQFFHQIFVLKNTRVGDAQRLARATYAGAATSEGGHRWTHFAYHMFCDPTMRLWLAEPLTPVVTHAASVNLGTPTLDVTVAVAGNGVGAVVGVSDASGRVSATPVGGGGVASVDLTGFNDTAGTLNVVVSGGNLSRYSGTVDVVATGAGHLRAEAISLDDDATGPSDGDGNQSADSGETVEWGFRFTNAGGGAAVNGATATLVPVDAPGATVLVDTAPVGSVANGAFVDASPFVVQLDPTIGDGALLHFEVQATDGIDTWVDAVELPVRAPLLRVTRLSVDDTAFGNGDGVVNAGETFDLVVEVINRGEADLIGLTANLSSAEPAISIADGTAAWPDLPPDAGAANLDALRMTEADVSVEHYSQIVFTDARGHQWTHDFELRPPGAPADPVPDTTLGPDKIALRMPGGAEPHFAGYRAYSRPLGIGDFTPLADEPSELTGLLVDAGLPELTRFEYYVTLVDSSRLESAPTLVVSASTAPGELSPGFPIPIGRELGGALAVGDLRGDGTNIVTFGADWLYAIDATGQELVDGDNDSQTLGPLGGDPANLRFSPSGVTLADLDNDGADEVIGSNWNSKMVWVLRGDGSNFPGWPRQMSGASWASPAVGDLDGNGDLEIVVNNIAGRLYVWNHDGTDFYDGDANPATVGVFQYRPGESFNRSTPALFDLDGDGNPEMIFGTHFRDGLTDNKVHAFRYDGTEAPGWPKSMGVPGYTVGHATIGDLDQNGTYEIVLLTENDQLNIWEPDGSNFGTAPYNVLSNAAAKDTRAPAAALADFDYDGDLEMVVVSTIDRDECQIMIMDHDGTIWPGWPRTLPGLSESSPLLGDLDGDNQIDIVFGIGGGTDGVPNILYAISPDASDVAGFPITLPGPVRSVPVISDFDDDGDVDVVYAGYDRLVHVWDMPFPYKPGLTPWPTFQADSQRTGVFQGWIATAVLTASIDLSATPDGVRIRAAFDGALPRDLRFDLERSVAGENDWKQIEGGLQADGGVLTFVDATARPGSEYEYRLVSGDGSSEFRSSTIVVPALRAAIRAAQPNPFNPRTTIQFDVPGTAGALVPTRLEVFDLRGRRIRQLQVGPLAPGPHEAVWDGVDDQGRGVASGVYFAVLRCAGAQETLKMSLVK